MSTLHILYRNKHIAILLCQTCIYFIETNIMLVCCSETRKFDLNLTQVYIHAMANLKQTFTCDTSNLLQVRLKFKLLSFNNFLSELRIFHVVE